MIIRQLYATMPFKTKDGSEIRSLLDLSNAPVRKQSLAEASLPPGMATASHYHEWSEEFYFVIEGQGRMRVGDEESDVGLGDAILIPSGSVHTLRNTGKIPLRILCCCSPPYSDEDTFLIE